MFIRRIDGFIRVSIRVVYIVFMICFFFKVRDLIFLGIFMIVLVIFIVYFFVCFVVMLKLFLEIFILFEKKLFNYDLKRKVNFIYIIFK